MWESSVNSKEAITSFKDELNKGIETNGSWDLDYTFICEKFEVIKCPFFNLENSVCRIQNCIIDLTSWRCMLLAAPSSSSRSIQISVHNCQLSAQHITDLSDTVLKTENGFKAIKLEFLKFVKEEFKIECIQALSPLFTSSIKLDFLSLRGNFFGDSLILQNLSSLHANFTLESLNLSDNRISDDGATALLRVLRINTTLIELSLSKNDITGLKSLESLSSLLIGSTLTTEDEIIIKKNTKVWTENNKKIKDLNKKRKKGGLHELPEIPILKREKSQKTLCNRNLLAIDLSFNPFISEPLLHFIDNIKKNIGTDSLMNSFVACPLTILLKSIPYADTIAVTDSDISDLRNVGVNVFF